MYEADFKNNNQNPSAQCSLFPKNKKLKLSKEGLKLLSKENIGTNQDNNNISSSTNNLNIRNPQKVVATDNSLNNLIHSSKNTVNKPNFIATNHKWNFDYGKNSTSINFFNNNANSNNKIRQNNYIKNNKGSSQKSGRRTAKGDRGSSVDQKYAMNTKLFEQFINKYETKVKNVLYQMGITVNSKPKNDKNNMVKIINDLPFLNQKNIKKKSALSNCNSNSETNIHTNHHNQINNIMVQKYNERKVSSSIGKKNATMNNFMTNNYTNHDANSFNNFIVTNSKNGNNNKILYSSNTTSIKNNIINSDNYSNNANLNTKSKTANSVNSAKGQTLNTNNNDLISFDNRNIKKQRAVSTAPYQIHQNDLNKKRNISVQSLCTTNRVSELSKYEIGKVIGKGAYAVVKLVKNKITQEKFAMKIYERSKLNDNTKKKCVYREIEVLKRLNHNNIAKLVDVINTQSQILIVQEFVNGISLREYYNREIRDQKGISQHKETIFKKIFKQIFDAMNYIHKNYMAHRDIKLENILMTKNYEIKIIDFGFGMYNPENKLQTFYCGTPNYMSPEIAFKKPYIGQKADLWSLGVLVYKIFCADFPFKGKNENDLYKNIQKGKFRMKAYIPEYVKKVISALIEISPNKRMSCENVLKSEWLKDE